MPTQIAEFVNRTFRGPRPADVERDRYSNALMRNEVDRLPQQNKMQDLAIQGAEMQINDTQRQNAAGVLGRNFSVIASSPRPRDAARAFIGSADFQTAGKLAGLPVDQFSVTDADTDDGIRQQAQAWADALSGRSQQQQRVQSTQVLEDGTIAYVTSDGQLVRTGERARNPMQLANVGGAPAMVDRLNAQVTPLSTPEAETQAAADRAAATTTATTTAQATAETLNTQRANERTLGVWQVARAGLVNALKGTDTGPVVGRLPAVTSGQQIAEGAVAAVAPVLKQLFRSAGEGVFTDRDQQLLLDMIPTRTDHPESAVAKIGMIDAIIQAKLSGGAAPGGPQVGTVQDGYRYKGGDPGQQSSWEKVN